MCIRDSPNLELVLGGPARADGGDHRPALVALAHDDAGAVLSLIHISEPTRLRRISYAVFCLKKKKKNKNHHPTVCGG